MEQVRHSIGRYRVVGPIGRGGMGEVYRATDTALGRDVALKILPAAVTSDPDRLLRFEREARAASALNHPHLIAIYDIGVDTPAGGAPVHYIAMELVDGHTLREAINQRRLDLPATLEYLAQAADALAAAHDAGVIHRDLKPENLMVASSGYVKVLDFGLAKLRADDTTTVAREAETRAALTTPGMLLGTAGYMSPEQAQERPSDHRSDIFAFGCILYEAAAGRRAFEGPSFVETLAKVIGTEPAPLPATTPPAVRAIVTRCLAKNPADRYQSMRDVAADLRRARRELEPHAPPKRQRVLMAAAGAALLAVALIGGWLAWKATRAPALPLDVQQLTASGNVIDTAISQDGRYLAWVESSGGMQGLWVRQVGGNRDIEIVPAARVGFWGIAFSPDGRSIYYTTRTASGGQQTGRLFSIDTLGGTPRPILDDIQSAVTFSPDGSQMAFLRGAFPQPNMVALIVAGVDGANVRALATRTSPQTFSGFFASASWSPDGLRIVAPSRNTATAEARLVVFDAATGAEEPMPAVFGDAGLTAWLPDGSGILFAAREPNSMAGVFQKQIWLQPYPKGEPRRITHDDLDYRNVWVTKDGRRFATVGERVGGGLWRVPLNGDPPQRIRSERLDGQYGVGVLPDGRMAIHATSRTGEQRIEIVAPDGASRQVVTDTDSNIWPAVSPDGQTIVFMSNRGGQTGIWRINADGTGARMLAALRLGSYLSVTHDGRAIVLSAPHEGIPAAWRVPIEGGEPTLIARSFDRATPSPDGKWLAGFYRASPSAPVALAVAAMDGSGPPRIFRPVPPATGFGIIEWSKDGQSIFYTTAERVNLFRQPLDGGDAVQVTKLTDLSFTFGDIAPDGLSVIASRGLAQRDAYLFSNFR